VSNLFGQTPAQGYEFMAIVVDDVDTASRTVHSRDRTGAAIQVSYRDQPGGIALVPKQGERWLAVRRGYSWFLEKRQDSAEEHDELAGYAPGDMRIRADGAIRMVGDSLTFNGSPVGGALARDEFEHPGTGFTSVTLTAAAQAGSVRVYLNGLLLPSTVWAWDPDTDVITFTGALGEAGFVEVLYSPA